MDNKRQWWGYQHTSGTLHVKPYFGKLDIEEAHESPFCKVVVGPFMVSDSEDAREILKEILEKQNENVSER